MLANITTVLVLVLLSTTAAPAELASDMWPTVTPLRSAELRADVDPRGYWVGPEI
jgi:hypothetical protein